MKTLVLASTSPYRARLLERLGLPFRTAAPHVDETPEPGEHPAALATRLARLKALSQGAEGAVTIGSDQTASLDGELLGKPGSRGAALAQLEACQGRVVAFHTAVAVVDPAAPGVRQHLELTQVHFATRSREDLERYVDREPAFDCAGGFKVEGLGITLFDAVETHDPTALVGLPLIWLARTLSELGLDPLGPVPDDAG